MSQEDKASEYRFEVNRLRSFGPWPFSASAYPTNLARAGFWYCGPEDTVKCFSCGILLDQWRKDDRPSDRHMKCAPNCSFIKGDYSGNVPFTGHNGTKENSTPRTESVSASYKDKQNHLYQQSSSLESAMDSETQTEKATLSLINEPVTLGLTEHCPADELQSMVSSASQPVYSHINQRLQSFSSWPSSNIQNPAKLAEAGFYYTGRDDRVRCFLCNGGLHNWEVADIPWVEHSRWFEKCHYVNICKEQPAVKALLETHKQVKESPFQSHADTENVVRTAENMSQPESDNNDSEVISSEKPLICMKCHVNLVGKACLPCGHNVLCAPCVHTFNIKHCPKCKNSVKGFITGQIDFLSLQIRM